MANKKEQVGYKRPPSHSRFKAGQSGNPRGSSKKARSSKGIFSEIGSRTWDSMNSANRSAICTMASE